MILRNVLQDDLANVIALVPYHPYRLNGQGNPKRDDNTFAVMDLKGGTPSKQEAVIKRFFCDLNPNVELGVVIVIVPSHDPATPDSGIKKLASRLASAGRIDGTGVLVRTAKVPKKHEGGTHGDLTVDLQSISVNQIQIIKGRPVLLMDDVTTSGGSLEACKQLLKQAGAGPVQCLAIGRTTY